MPIAPGSVVEALRSVPAFEAAAARLRAAALGADAARDAALVVPDSGLAVESASTPFGNVAQALSRGAESPGETALVSALFALSFATAPPSTDADRRAAVAKIIQFSSHTKADPLAYLDAALGDRADDLWRDVSALATDPGSPLDRAERLVATRALTSSASAVAKSSSRGLSTDGSGLPAPRAEPLAGELVPAPFGVVGTILFTLSGLSLVRGLARITGRLAFSYREPAALALNERGLELEHRTEMLGRVLRSRAVVVPFENIASVAREMRYARLGLYAGLVTLVLGTYVGVGLLVDGARVPGGSPSLLGIGLLAIAIGVVLDFVLSVVLDVVRTTCRIVVTPRQGRRFCINGLDPEATNRLLQRLTETVSPEASG